MHLELESRGKRRLADHVAEFGRRRGGHVEPARSLAELHQLRKLGDPVPEVGADGRHDPHRAGARQPGQEADERHPVFGRNRGQRKQLFELIDDQDELGVFVRQYPAGGAFAFRRARQCPLENEARRIERRAQVIDEIRSRLPGAQQFRQADALMRRGSGQRLDQPADEIVAAIARPEDETAHERHPFDALGFHQTRDQRRLHQRGFSRSARAGDQQERRAGARLAGELLRGLGHHPVAAEKDRCMLEFVGLQPAERVVVPDVGALRLLRRAHGLDAALDELAQRLLQALGKLLDRAIAVVGRHEHAAVGKMPGPERVQRIELGEAPGLCLQIDRIDRRRAHIPKRQDVRGAARLCRPQCLLELPLGPGHRHAAVEAAVLAQLGLLGQGRAEPRPQDQNDGVERARRVDRVLERSGREHRLVLPAKNLQEKVPAIFLRKLVDHQVGSQALLRDIARR